MKVARPVLRGPGSSNGLGLPDKKLGVDDLRAFRDMLQLPVTDDQIGSDGYSVPYYHPGADAPEVRYALQRRRDLGGFLPQRRVPATPALRPDDKPFSGVRKGSGTQDAATTMAFVRLLRDLMRDPQVGPRIVPIVPDEARTFGMDSFFPSAKIYNPGGQRYTSVDRSLLLSYQESVQGQVLHTGINEAGSFAAFTAAGTAYATHGEPMVPVYVFYSMFGFQRTGDAMWAAMDQMTRGFIIGATAGRTTLVGEGLQHADGHSPLLAATNPAVKVYDPAYGYEIAHIMRAGLDQMYGPDTAEADRDVMYYLTVYNEPFQQPAEPDDVDAEGILRGMHKISSGNRAGSQRRVQLFASGIAVPWALKAQQLLAQDWQVSADVWSITSWTELRRDARRAEQHNFLHPEEPAQVGYLIQRLAGVNGPIVAVSDYESGVPDQLRGLVPNAYHVLGADGHGFSDTRQAARRYFGIDSHSVAARAVAALAEEGSLPREAAAEAVRHYRLPDVAAGSTGRGGGDA